MIALIKTHTEETTVLCCWLDCPLIPMADARGSCLSHDLLGLKSSVQKPQAGDRATRGRQFIQAVDIDDNARDVEGLWTEEWG